MERSDSRTRDWLAVAATLFLAANLLHGADHVRQHLAGLDVAVMVGGALLMGGAILVFSRRRHPGAPLLAAVVGFGAAILVAGSHIAPHWSTFSDSYVDDIHPDALSWAVMLFEVVAALVLGLAGVVALRARAGGPRQAPQPTRV